MKTAIFDKKGKEVKQISLPKDIFDIAWNGDLVHEVVVSMNSNSRENIAHTKDRAEVSGGGKKPWRQKGTGRARHGSSRSPLWVGGGTTFGPRNDKNYSKKINKKVRSKALAIVLSQKARDGEIILIDSVKVSDIKTKSAQDILTHIAKNKEFAKLSAKNGSALIAMSERDQKTEKSFRNISKVQLDLINNMNIVDILKNKFLIIENPESAFEVLAKRVIISKDNK